ncbi:MAG TPA: hypothetical protein VGJ87_27030, partial [Roseiflexaceae bacterium]
MIAKQVVRQGLIDVFVLQGQEATLPIINGIQPVPVGGGIIVPIHRGISKRAIGEGCEGEYRQRLPGIVASNPRDGIERELEEIGVRGTGDGTHQFIRG